ncbi:MAG: Rieske 2Fe-2S domain-containing protein [Anaerolineae bacterium]
MSVLSRRRFIASVAGAVLISGCGSVATPTVAPPPPAATSGSQATPPAATSATPLSTDATLPPVAAAAASLAAGQGAVMTVAGDAVAIYKDAQGTVTALSPKCPHQGCQVAWNAADGTWDCPCHGSRFNADGSLKNGPASKGLTAIS